MNASPRTRPNQHATSPTRRTETAMMHDFALTPGYLVLLDVPVTFSLGAVSAELKLPYTWNPAHQARVGLLPRGRSAVGVRWFEVDHAGSSIPSTPTTTAAGSWST